MDTPQQNSVVERKHRQLLETTRALSIQANLPSNFWGDYVLFAAYTINKLPLSNLNNISPYQKLFNHKLQIDHLKAYGFLCFVSTLKQQRIKFLPRAHACVFLE